MIHSVCCYIFRYLNRITAALLLSRPQILVNIYTYAQKSISHSLAHHVLRVWRNTLMLVSILWFITDKESLLHLFRHIRSVTFAKKLTFWNGCTQALKRQCTALTPHPVFARSTSTSTISFENVFRTVLTFSFIYCCFFLTRQHSFQLYPNGDSIPVTPILHILPYIWRCSSVQN